MFSQFLSQEIAVPDRLSLQDLLDDRAASNFSEYFSLSFSRSDGVTLISLTTTGNEPVTYTTEISNLSAIDLTSLVFVAQRVRRNS